MWVFYKGLYVNWIDRESLAGGQEKQNSCSDPS